MMAFAVRNILQEMPATPPFSSRGSENNVASIPESFLTPSPEEQIIRQRSRLVALQHNGNENETPSKELLLCQQGRKRLLLSSPHASPMKCNSKRSRLQRSVKLPPLKTELAAYTTQQLVEIIDRLVNNYPDLENEIRETLPSPDMKPLEERLNALQRNIYKAFPNTRWGSSRDAFCFKRVKVHLEVFKKTCIDQGRLLLAAQCWESLVRYVVVAWRYNAQLPDWDDSSHNRFKESCHRALASLCLQAIKKGLFEKEMYREIKRKLENLPSHNSELEHCIKECGKIMDTLE